MKLNLRFLRIDDTKKNRHLVQRELEPLVKDLPVQHAETTVAMPAEGDGRIEAHVHLAVPGPDIKASASDYTLQAVLRKLGRRIKEALKHRASKRSAQPGHLRLSPSQVR
jgi:ribosome-associated translation inhibitor RaiA